MTRSYVTGTPVSMQDLFTQNTPLAETWHYSAPMPRPISKPRPRQGTHLSKLRQAAGLTQAELARLIEVPQQSIAYWEVVDKPPRSDVLPKLAHALNVSVEELLGTENTGIVRKNGPAGKLRKTFDEVAALPRRQQEKIVEIVTALVEQYTRAKG